ncbi:MAG: orotate phosphoribosyltransferase [Bacteroidales bacterium]|jgi:orotate phosphoribosyltransferase|nr:orotate phosphoribosyltransferase [Bacteroidales bacterium]MBQ1219455.1 orotate phosphoribosyltransferase [Bacteroidales bacterium]MBQ1930193.1 orotate phosphoribosyltransferase [Bacteroidales bacterium]MBQ5784643.1 orotate phosphoribosyltransferase [Bacteroidales bacterium]MBR6540970.1 orotate phosphoribosyltransferase [Bacteroidales bacterium]
MESIEKIVAKQLLDIKAVKLSPENPFTWASGWKSPIYCDNRKVLSYPAARKVVYNAFVEIIKKNFKDVDVIAGVATGAIAVGMMVAEVLDKPFVYVRPKPKDHGTGAQVEGDLAPGARVVVVEDLISTGGSSLSAVGALEKSGAIVLGMVAIFTYNFIKSIRAFENANVELHTLSHYEALLEAAAEANYIKAEELDILKEWRLNPEEWGK